MSETLNLGAGNWGVKDGSLLGYNSENGNFKPLPFTFDRSTSATRVNKQGLIEVVPNNEPRIDFLNDSKGALLLEPSRTNLIPSNVSDWVVFQSNVTQSNQSPDGYNNAIKITSNAVVNSGVYFSGLSVSGNTEIFTIWLKGENGGEILEIGDATNRTTVTLTNEWVRYEAKAISASAFKILYNQTTNPIVQTWYAWGPQLEDNVSYATSYIPTQGSAVTRVAESTSQTVPSGIIGQTEGTIFYDINLNNIETSSQYIGVLSDGGSTNRIQFLNNISQDWQLFITASTISNNISLTTSTDGVGRYKIAIAYKSGDVVFYVNGVQKGTSTETFTFSNLLHFDLGQRYDDSFFFNNSINNSKLYNTRLTNAELQALTS